MDFITLRNEKLGKKVCEALNKRFFEAYFVPTKEEILPKVLELIPPENSVSWGGSMTLESLGIKDALKERGYNPTNQLVGYLISGDPGYISSYKDARSRIQEIDRSWRV